MNMIPLIGLTALCLGIVVLWANPTRLTNQAFSLFAILVAIWLGLVTAQVTAADPGRWIRANAALSTFFPWIMWVLKESLLNDNDNTRYFFRRSFPWLILGVVLSIHCYSDSFISYIHDTANYHRGYGYIIHIFVLLLVYLSIIIDSFRQVQLQTGIRRLELQIFVLNISVATFLTLAFLSVGNIWNIYALKTVGLLVILGMFVMTAWATTVHRIFDAKQVYTFLGHRVAVVIIISIGAWGLWRIVDLFLIYPLGLIASIMLCVSAGFWLDYKSREWLHMGGDQILAQRRQAVIEIARTELDPGRLFPAFEMFLRRHYQTAFAGFLVDVGQEYAGSKLSVSKGSLSFAGLLELEWATPETLQRRRSTPRLDELRKCVIENSFGVIIPVPRGSSTPSLLLVLGTKEHGWPFTYPEVQQLQNIGELMDNILTHARLTNQAALQAKMEHLAMMSRGLAHDLKNLITPVSSFLVHTDGHYKPDSPEAEVHDAAKRSVRIMTDYVREALFFSERLSPKFEAVDLPLTFSAVCDVTRARADRRGVTLAAHSSLGATLDADGILVQRMLANLVGNAIDASAAGQTVTLSAQSARPGWLQIQVKDTGCGVAPEHLHRIFDPYFTTKEFGDDVRGFGLGLTICQKIVHLHGGTISVKSEVGKGTTATVDLPLKREPIPPSAPRIPAARPAMVHG